MPSPIGIGPDLVSAATPELTQLEPIEKRQPNGVTDPMPLQRGRKYEVVFLGTFGGYQTISYRLNNSDQVVGESQLTGGAQSHPFLYRNRQLIDLNPDPSSPGGRATGINDDGQVVGYASDRKSTFAFTWRDGHIISIGELIQVPSSSFASGINSSGTIVGYSSFTNGGSAPFIYRNGNVEVLTSLQSSLSGVSAINDRDQIAGFFSPAPGRYRAFFYDSGKFSDLGTILGDQSQALKINNKGQIVGFQTVSNGSQRAFLLQDDKLIELGVGSSMAEGINDAGDVVGQHLRLNQSPFAFLWTPQDGLLDLNACTENQCDGTTPGFTEIFDAKDINERGNIAASGNYFDGQKTIQAACLLMRI